MASVEIVAAVAANVADFAPAGMVTEPGCASCAVLSDNAIIAPPAGATALIVTVQMVLSPEVRKAAGQLRSCSVTPGAGGTSEMDAVFEIPAPDAVTTAVCADVRVPVLAVNACVVAPEGTVRLAGVVSMVLLLASVTTKPLAPAAFVSATVQETLVFEAAEAGQLREERVGAVAAAVKVNAVPADVPFHAAVTVAVALAVTAAAVAVNVAEEAPAGIVTDAGKLNCALLSERVTAAPPVDAGPDKVTVQAADPGVAIDVGVQLSDLTPGVELS